MKKSSACVYIAPIDRINELKEELKNISFEKDNFIIAEGPLQKSYWAQNIWIEAQKEKVESIKKAADFLKAIQRNWSFYPLQLVRRGTLIQESLPKIKKNIQKFPTPLPTSPLGSFALLSENEMIYSPTCTAPLPNGEFHYEEPEVETPSGAYKKLWEAITRFGTSPQPGDSCVDIGSSPGSWTQALLNLNCRVFSIDRSDLEIPLSSRLTHVKGDAFKLKPSDIQNPKWICSDIISYPDKLYEMALAWKKEHPNANYIFTIKFQKKWDKEYARKFSEIPHSKVLHLFNNKHELCWMSGPDLK